jgi:hypothetical protein
VFIFACVFASIPNLLCTGCGLGDGHLRHSATVCVYLELVCVREQEAGLRKEDGGMREEAGGRRKEDAGMRTEEG